MQSCPYGIQISAYHDGELPPVQRQEVEGHLQQCAACADELRQLRRISEFLAATPVPHLDPNQKNELYALAPATREFAYMRIAEWVSAVAAAVLLAASSWMIYRNVQPSAPPVANGESASIEYAFNPQDATAPDAQSASSFGVFVVNDLSASERP